jgi:hypothetical protein
MEPESDLHLNWDSNLTGPGVTQTRWASLRVSGASHMKNFHILFHGPNLIVPWKGSYLDLLVGEINVTHANLVLYCTLKPYIKS